MSDPILTVETNEAEASIEAIPTPEEAYIVHGARIYCSCGTELGYLLLEKSHGVYIHEIAQAHKYDNKNVNIDGLGACGALSTGLEGLDKEERLEVIAAMARDSSLIQDIVQIDAQEWQDMKIKPCCPDIRECWQHTKAKTLVKGQEALIIVSTLICAHGGIIKFSTNGQFDEL